MNDPSQQTMRDDEPPIILLPGMAADDRLFRFQRAALPSLVVPNWIEPRAQGVPRRLRRAVRTVHRPRRSLLRRWRTRSGEWSRWRWRSTSEPKPASSSRASDRVGNSRGSSAPSDRSPGSGLVNWDESPPGSPAGSLLPCRGRTSRRLRRLAEPRSAFLRWASWAVLNWRPSPEAREVRIYQIHGAERPDAPRQVHPPGRGGRRWRAHVTIDAPRDGE